MTTLDHETERHVERLRILAKHLSGSAEFGPATPFVEEAVAHMRKLATYDAESLTAQRAIATTLGMMHEPDQGPCWPASWKELTVAVADLRRSYGTLRENHVELQKEAARQLHELQQLYAAFKGSGHSPKNPREAAQAIGQMAESEAELERSRGQLKSAEELRAQLVRANPARHIGSELDVEHMAATGEVRTMPRRTPELTERVEDTIRQFADFLPSATIGAIAVDVLDLVFGKEPSDG
jgi:hypothetical protein